MLYVPVEHSKSLNFFGTNCSYVECFDFSLDLNSLLPMSDLEDFLSPLPEPSASGTLWFQPSELFICMLQIYWWHCSQRVH